MTDQEKKRLQECLDVLPRPFDITLPDGTVYKNCRLVDKGHKKIIEMKVTVDFEQLGLIEET